MHGLLVASELPIGAPGPRVADAEPDVGIRWSAVDRVEDDLAFDAGVDIAAPDNLRLRAMRRDDDAVQLRLQGLADVVISADRRRADVTSRSEDRATTAVAVAGTLLALILGLRGHCALHASAVELDDGRALAFAGPRGQGKSTLAALAMAAGCSLVSDDLLRIDIGTAREDAAPLVHRGTGALRLRPGAAAYLEPVLGPFKQSIDGRSLAQGRAPSASVLPLGAIVLPAPVPPDERLRTERLGPRDALLALLALPRLPALADPAIHAVHLDVLAAVVTRVSVVRARIPWLRPLDPARFRSLMEALVNVW